MDDNRVMTFLSQHWSKLLLGVMVIITAGAWGERWLRSQHKEKNQDFVTAQQIFDRFNKGEYLPIESIEATQNILDRHPELHPKYDRVLALTFFAQQNLPEGTRYARTLIEHADSQLPAPYKDYAHTTLLISEGKYGEALAAATALEKTLANDAHYPTLDAMNTLRILFLAEKLEDASRKQVCWEKLSKSSVYASIAAVFQEGNLSLEDYFRGN